MEKTHIIEIIRSSLTEYLESRGENVEINENTALIGRKAVIDSIGLVNLIVDIESRLLDAEHEISLLSEKAMSQTNSPFRNVQTLSDFIIEEISGT
jgi:acyl carrier protein